MKILFWGDVMPGGVLPYNHDEIIGDAIQADILTYDIRMATLECALADGLEFDSEKMRGRANVIYAPISCGSILSKLKLNVVSLANNHVLDLGLAGLQSTIAYLNKIGIRHTGAGNNLEEAIEPVIIEKGGISIAVLAGCTYDFAQVGHVQIATSSNYGIVPLEDEVMVEKIRFCKKRYNHVIVLAHWGKEYLNFPASSQLSIAKRLVRAGCDLVIGSHPHVVQPKMSIQGKTVFFSLGNGLFPDFLMQPPRPIWYPDKEEFKDLKIPKTYDYPFPINRPYLRIWPDKFRIGMVVSADVKKNRINARYNFIYLNKENMVNYIGNCRLKIKLNLISQYMKVPKYDEGKRLWQFKNGLKQLIKRGGGGKS